MSEKNDQNEQDNVERFKIDADEEIAQGVYSNLVVLHMKEGEFVLDFIFTQPQSKNAKVRSRVILSPENVKRFHAMLSHNIEEYEKGVGNIGDEPGTSIDIHLN